MADNKVAWELLLNSNEFILPLSKGDAHALPLVLKANVPVVVSSDDPGILRTTLTREYVTLANKFRNVTYQQIRTMALNGITYSFIKDEELKLRIKKQLRIALTKFESEASLQKVQVKVARAMAEERAAAAAAAAAAGAAIPATGN
jgi:adenosine deaminase